MNIHSSIVQSSPKVETIHLSTNWQVEKQIKIVMAYPYNGILLSREKEGHVTTCMNFEKITVSENSQMQKTIFYDYIVWFPLYDISRMSKFIEIESRLMVSRGWCEGRWRVIVIGYSVVFGGDENVLELDRSCSCKYCKYTKCHWIVSFKIAKMVNFMLCEFYLS